MGEVLRLEKTEIEPEFSEFWLKYPRKTKKAHALKMWQRLTSGEKTAAVLALPAHVRYWNGREVEFIPHAGSWLNPVDGRRWEDELPTAGQVLAVQSKCVRCGGSIAAGFTKRRDGLVCNRCEQA